MGDRHIGPSTPISSRWIIGRWPNSAMNPSGSSLAGDMWKLIPTPCSVASSRAARHSGSLHVVWPTTIDHVADAIVGDGLEVGRADAADGRSPRRSYCRYTPGSGGRSHTHAADAAADADLDEPVDHLVEEADRARLQERRRARLATSRRPPVAPTVAPRRRRVHRVQLAQPHEHVLLERRVVGDVAAGQRLAGDVDVGVDQPRRDDEVVAADPGCLRVTCGRCRRPCRPRRSDRLASTTAPLRMMSRVAFIVTTCDAGDQRDVVGRSGRGRSRHSKVVAPKVRPSVQRCYVRAHDPTQHLDLRRSARATIPRPPRGSTPRSSAGRSKGGRPACSTASCPAATSRSPTARRRRSATCTWASTTSPTPGRTPIPPASSHARRAPRVAPLRIWILVADDDSDERILDTRRASLGATELWRNHYWAEFNGFNSAFLDPWGNTFVLWTKGGSDPVVPEGWTRE